MMNQFSGNWINPFCLMAGRIFPCELCGGVLDFVFAWGTSWQQLK